VSDNRDYVKLQLSDRKRVRRKWRQEGASLLACSWPKCEVWVHFPLDGEMSPVDNKCRQLLQVGHQNLVPKSGRIIPKMGILQRHDKNRHPFISLDENPRHWMSTAMTTGGPLPIAVFHAHHLALELLLFVSQPGRG
jgi:hypothetical protein